MWEELLKVIGDNEEAKSIVAKLQESSNGNVKKINELESKFNEAKQGRDNLKSLIRSGTGLEEVNEESLSEFVAKLKGAKGDEKLSNEIENLKGLLEKANGERASIVTDYESKLQNMALTNNLRDLGIGSLAINPMAEKMILEHLKSGATLDGENIVYKKEDGTTLYDGTNVITPQSRLEQLKSDDNWKPFLKPDIHSGGGANESRGGSVNKSNFGGSKEDRQNAIKQKFNL
jgi:hypothetical protein